MGAPCKQARHSPVKYIQFFCKASTVVRERLCKNFLKMRKHVAQTVSGNTPPLTSKNFSEEIAAYISRFRKHANRTDAHTLSVIVCSWQSSAALSSEDETSTLRIMENMHNNFLDSMKAVYNTATTRQQQGECGDTRATKHAHADAGALDTAVDTASFTLEEQGVAGLMSKLAPLPVAYAQYVPELSAIDASVMQDLDAAAFLPPRRWDWSPEIKIFYADA